MSKEVMRQALKVLKDTIGEIDPGPAIAALTATLALPDAEPAIALTAEGPGWHKFPAHLQNPDGRSLMTASYLLGRQGYTSLAEILKGMAEDLLEKGPTLPSGAAIAPTRQESVMLPDAEPFGYWDRTTHTFVSAEKRKEKFLPDEKSLREIRLMPLYTHAQPNIAPEPVELTEEEIYNIYQTKGHVTWESSELRENKFTEQMEYVKVTRKAFNMFNFAQAIEVAVHAKKKSQS